MTTSTPPRKKRGKIIVLTTFGLILLVASLTIRFLDRPRDVEPLDQSDAEYNSAFFGVGLTVGDFEDLGCSSLCPTSLIFEYDAAEPDLVYGKFLGTLEGTQNGTEPARIFLVAPGSAGEFTLTESTESDITMTVDSVVLPSGDDASGSTTVPVVTLSVPAIDGSSYFGVTFDWRPGAALATGGIGRQNLRIAYTASHPALDQKEAYSLDIADPADSLKDVGIEVEATGTRIGNITPDADGRPTPRSVFWRVGTSQPEGYYVATFERSTVRFWVGLVNEQTLSIAGLLLGAVVGAVASDWFTRRSA